MVSPMQAQFGVREILCRRWRLRLRGGVLEDGGRWSKETFEVQGSEPAAKLRPDIWPGQLQLSVFPYMGSELFKRRRQKRVIMKASPNTKYLLLLLFRLGSALQYARLDIAQMLAACTALAATWRSQLRWRPHRSVVTGAAPAAIGPSRSLWHTTVHLSVGTAVHLRLVCFASSVMGWTAGTTANVAWHLLELGVQPT